METTRVCVTVRPLMISTRAQSGNSEHDWFHTKLSNITDKKRSILIDDIAFRFYAKHFGITWGLWQKEFPRENQNL